MVPLKKVDVICHQEMISEFHGMVVPTVRIYEVGILLY